MGVYEKLLAIQTELKAPKAQFNNFGKYKYRNCEDILESLKPILAKNRATITISDDVVSVGNRIYIRATAKIVDTETGESVETTAYAREEESKKGMDGSQLTGSSSSYARKYALNGLFAIDDTKDSDYCSPELNRPLKQKTKNELNQLIAEYAEKTDRAVGEIVNEVKNVVKKELSLVSENEAADILLYLKKKVNKKIKFQKGEKHE